LPWTSGEVALFCVRHFLGVRFEKDALVLKPALYPGTQSVSADLRFREGRLLLRIDGSGPILSVLVNGVERKPAADGSLRLPSDFSGGEVLIKTAR
jgi:cellobiose phosphorylase